MTREALLQEMQTLTMPDLQWLMRRVAEIEVGNVEGRDSLCAEAASRYLTIMSEVCGGTDRRTLLKSKLLPFPAARNLVAYALYQEGFTQSAIARVMGRKPCTISIAMRDIEYALSRPVMYDDHQYLWNKFNEKRYGNTNENTDADSLQV